MNNKTLASMNEIQSHSMENHSVLIADSGLPRSLLYFHGFPGPFDQTNPGEIRIADQLFDLIKKTHNLFYPLYTTKTAAFNFSDALMDAQSALLHLRKVRPNDPLTLIGQSWGANLALQLAQTVEVERLILIVPFLFLPTGTAALNMVRYYSQQFPNLLPPERIHAFTKQIGDLANQSAPAKLLEQIEVQTTIIAAANDELIPIEKVRSLVRAMNRPNLDLIVLDRQAHAIENRQMLWDVFRDAFT